MAVISLRTASVTFSGAFSAFGSCDALMAFPMATVMRFPSKGTSELSRFRIISGSIRVLSTLGRARRSDLCCAMWCKRYYFLIVVIFYTRMREKHPVDKHRKLTDETKKRKCKHPKNFSLKKLYFCFPCEKEKSSRVNFSKMIKNDFQRYHKNRKLTRASRVISAKLRKKILRRSDNFIETTLACANRRSERDFGYAIADVSYLFSINDHTPLFDQAFRC